MKQKRSTEWKGRGFNDRRGKTYRIEEDRWHRWKREGNYARMEEEGAQD
jgi:hypothetical protein